MRITINSFGTRGDVQPYIALGQGLAARGHQVRLLSHDIFESFVRQHGLDFHPVAINPRQVLLEHDFAEFGRSMVRFTRFLRESYHLLLDELFRVTDEAAEGADLLINSAFSLAGYHAAQKRGLPVIGAVLQPNMPSRFLRSMLAPPPPRWMPFKGLYNYLSTKFANQLFFHMLRPITNASRKKVLGLPPLGAGYYWRADSGRVPMLFGYSPLVIPKPPDWGDLLQVTGYWFLDLAEGYEPPTELTAFLEAGSRPVYIGFGSSVDHESQALTRLITEAVEMADCRAILLGGWSDLGDAAGGDRIFCLDYAPHDWLFPRMAAVVHHGGAGTTATGLRAGVPGIVVPSFGDQFFWGERVAELEVGPAPLSREGLTADRLADALRAVMDDREMQARAQALGQQIAAEDGVGRAVDAIERMPPVRI
jgi:UDP:flavonoid glycosyltransferase YjiC (YdhE family)